MGTAVAAIGIGFGDNSISFLKVYILYIQLRYLNADWTKFSAVN